MANDTPSKVIVRVVEAQSEVRNGVRAGIQRHRRGCIRGPEFSEELCALAPSLSPVSPIASFRFQHLTETLRVQHLDHPPVIIDHLAVVGPRRALVLLAILTGTHPYIPLHRHHQRT